MARIIFSLTQHQAEALVAFAAGEPIAHPRVETSLRLKLLIHSAHGGQWRLTLTRRGRAALALARALLNQ